MAWSDVQSLVWLALFMPVWWSSKTKEMGTCLKNCCPGIIPCALRDCRLSSLKNEGNISLPDHADIVPWKETLLSFHPSISFCPWGQSTVTEHTQCPQLQLVTYNVHNRDWGSELVRISVSLQLRCHLAACANWPRATSINLTAAASPFRLLSLDRLQRERDDT